MKRGDLRRKLDKHNEQQRFLAYRVRMVPQQLDAARRKVAALEREAARYGMHDLLRGGEGTIQ